MGQYLAKRGHSIRYVCTNKAIPPLSINEWLNVTNSTTAKVCAYPLFTNQRGMFYIGGNMAEYIGLIVAAVLTLVFGYLAVRAWSAKRLWVKLVAGIPTTLIVLLAGTVTVVAGKGYNTMNAIQPNPVPQVTVAGTPEQLAKGERIARTCAGCHASNGEFPLSGRDFTIGGPPFGTFWAPNLTPTHLGSWSDGEIIRAIREGVGKDGRSLITMPSKAFRNFSDDDVQALVAYLRSSPAVEPDSPVRQVNLLGAVLVGISPPADVLSVQPPVTDPVIAPARAATVEYGQYLTSLGCQDCHGAALEGQPTVANGPPGGPSIVAYAKAVSEDQFVATLRTGIKADGTALSIEMPWKDLEKFSDDDFRAIYRYLNSK
jgi:mono/diheme cytochrome c family protein